MVDTSGCIVGSDNIFADLGYADPNTALVKAELARQIGAIIRREGWTQTQAAQVLGIDQPKVSAILNGRLRDFAPDRLETFLLRLNQDIEIHVRPNTDPGRPARRVVYAEEPIAAEDGGRTEMMRFD